MVTGGASGIGEAIVRKFCDEGAQVAIVDRQEAPWASDLGVPTFKCDVGDEADVKDAFQTIVTEIGHVDILCNNAGINQCFKSSATSFFIF